MELITKNVYFKVLFWLFIIISIAHIVYATITMRGLYADGTYHLFDTLELLLEGKIKTTYDSSHPRDFINIINHFPVAISFLLFQIKSKYALILIYCATLVSLPFIALLLNYKLSQRTQRYDIFFWSLFNYGAVTILFSIFAMTESILGSVLNFILFNYLVGSINYKKRDILAIIFLILVAFETNEYMMYLGVLFFLVSLYYASKEENVKNKIVKLSIGIGSLLASVYNIFFFLSSQIGANSELPRVIKELSDFWPYANLLNVSLSLVAIGLMILILWEKTQIKYIYLIFSTLIFAGAIARLFMNLEMSIYPMWETHVKNWHYVLLPIMFIIIISHEFIKNTNRNILYSNIILIALLCGIFQSIWQIVETYYWDKNVSFLKQELKTTDKYLFIPTYEREISSFHNKELRRFIWHGTFPTLSILLSETKEIKPLLMTHEETRDSADPEYRDIFKIYEGKELLYLPIVGPANPKTIFWDFSKAVDELEIYLEEYNKKNKV